MIASWRDCCSLIRLAGEPIPLQSLPYPGQLHASAAEFAFQKTGTQTEACSAAAGTFFLIFQSSSILKRSGNISPDSLKGNRLDGDIQGCMPGEKIIETIRKMNGEQQKAVLHCLEKSVYRIIPEMRSEMIGTTYEHRHPGTAL